MEPRGKTAVDSPRRPLAQYGWEEMRQMFPGQQNIKAEIENLQSTLDTIPEDTIPDQSSQILQDCKNRLHRVEKTFSSKAGILYSLYIWISMHWISQRLLLVQPKDKLHDEWLSLKGLVSKIPSKERGIWKQEKLDEIENAFKKQLPDEKRVRSELELLRRFIADRIDTVLWHAIITNWSIFSLTLILVTLGFIFVLRIQAGSTSQTPNIWNSVIIGALGATLSSISSFFLERPDVTGPPFVNRMLVNVLCRPVIGAIAGLFLYLISFFKWIQVDPVQGFYVLALAFGFSERLFAKSLHNIAVYAEGQIGIATGLGARE